MIFVTGASGLVGAHLIQSLIEKGKPVIALYRKEIYWSIIKKRAISSPFCCSIKVLHSEGYGFTSTYVKAPARPVWIFWCTTWHAWFHWCSWPLWCLSVD
jgi:hypothetical protein